MSAAKMSQRRAEIEGLGAPLSDEEQLLAAEHFPERLAITEADYNAGARLADDHFCQCCGKRGVIGRYCRTCEESGR